MIINWAAAKAQQFLPIQDTELDELSVSFDFALSAEMMGLLYAQNDACMDAGGTTPRMEEVEQLPRATQGTVAETVQQAEAADSTEITQVALDEHELALA
jgi:hypothetical protein